jgi:hypothetical protein
MKSFLSIFLFAISFCSGQESFVNPLTVKENYSKAFFELNDMLNGKQEMNFKKAAFTTENAYENEKLSYDTLNAQIEMLTSLCKAIMQSKKLLYTLPDSNQVEKCAVVFSLMMDTTKIIYHDNLYYRFPFTYDFDDVWGEGNWEQMFVSKLLNTGKGNCHSLPFLYKILMQELGSNAFLSLAPNHIYIKLRNQKDGWYNTELTSGYFPIDAWLMASGYIHLSAIQNAIYMDTLSNKQSVALCMIDLAKGYEKKNVNGYENFVLQCCDTALTYFPNYINALLLKAETQKKIFESMMKHYGAIYPKEVFNIKVAKDLFDEMQNLYASIHKLGYRTMPKGMYLDWLVSIKTEKEKYQNKKVTTFTSIKN